MGGVRYCLAIGGLRMASIFGRHDAVVLRERVRYENYDVSAQILAARSTAVVCDRLIEGFPGPFFTFGYILAGCCTIGGFLASVHIMDFFDALEGFGI